MSRLMANEIPRSSATQRERESEFTGFCVEVMETLISDARREFAAFAGDIIDAASKVKTLQQDSQSESPEELSKSINALVIKMQFSDRFCQRLENVQGSLVLLKGRFDADPKLGSIDDVQWQALLTDTRGLFTTEQERMQFDQYFDLVPEIAEEQSASDSNSSESDLDDLLF